MDITNGYLRGLTHPRGGQRRRVSSWDRTGANTDHWWLEPGQEATVADIAGAGLITHMWFTSNSDEPYWLRRALLRLWWDDEESPSVEVPFGDFFGCGHGMRARLFVYASRHERPR